MTQTIKAIETRYQGYRFRSRLEARWAVFFDAMGWRWEYEPEGYVGTNGTPYLPDFQIGGHVYVEIKPMPYGTRDEIIARYRHYREQWGGFIAGQSNAALLILTGTPRLPEIRGMRYYPDHEIERVELLACRRCDGIAWGEHGFIGREAGDELQGCALYGCAPGCTADAAGRWPLVTSRMERAVASARGARFEHGESGGVA